MDQSPHSAATAACGAYLLVALADARVERAEEARFLGGIVNHQAFKFLSAESLSDEYNRLSAALRDEWDSTEAEILAAIASIRNHATAAEAVKLAARHAVVADLSLRPQEEIVLARVARALGLEPGEL
jgi:tellurite resistance protein